MENHYNRLIRIHSIVTLGAKMMELRCTRMDGLHVNTYINCVIV